MNCLYLKNFVITSGVVIALTPVALAVPPWAKTNTQALSPDGETYSVVCSGNSATIGQARQEAVIDCDQQAARQLKTTTTVKSLSVETETQVGYHSEISSEVKVQGLNCRALQEDADYSPQGIVTVFLKCKYDLSGKSKDIDANDGFKPIQSEQPINVSLSTIPKCSSILVRGSRSRTIDCKTNPVNLSLFPSDTEIVIRADGHIPQSLKPADITGGSKNVFLKLLN